MLRALYWTFHKDESAESCFVAGAILVKLEDDS